MALSPNYARIPIAFTHGQGAYLYDAQGTAYLDSFAGIAVTGLGHAHPELCKVLAAQAARYWHTSNWFQSPEQETLAASLCAKSGMEDVFFANSGAEANEAAIKAARLYGAQKGCKKPGILVFDNAFHGRTFATLSASGNRAIQAGFEPLMPHFYRAPFIDMAAVRTIANNVPDMVAVLVEPIQGEGGVQTSDKLPELAAFCAEHNWLFMADEVQTGIGRTGNWFGHQTLSMPHKSIRPDVMTLAKGLGNGIPIGACLFQGKAAGILTAGKHGSTFGGNPLAMAVAAKVLDIIERDNLLARATYLGNEMARALNAALPDFALRQKGLMLGLDLPIPAADLPKAALAHGILMNVTQGRTVRLLPPLTLTDGEAGHMIDTVIAAIRAFLDRAAMDAD